MNNRSMQCFDKNDAHKIATKPSLNRSVNLYTRGWADRTSITMVVRQRLIAAIHAAARAALTRRNGSFIYKYMRSVKWVSDWVNVNNAELTNGTESFWFLQFDYRFNTYQRIHTYLWSRVMLRVNKNICDIIIAPYRVPAINLTGTLYELLRISTHLQCSEWSVDDSLHSRIFNCIIVQQPRLLMQSRTATRYSFGRHCW